jgi:hypothetical protein
MTNGFSPHSVVVVRSGTTISSSEVCVLNHGRWIVVAEEFPSAWMSRQRRATERWRSLDVQSPDVQCGSAMLEELKA